MCLGGMLERERERGVGPRRLRALGSSLRVEETRNLTYVCPRRAVIGAVEKTVEEDDRTAYVDEGSFPCCFHFLSLNLLPEGCRAVDPRLTSLEECRSDP